jgi:hypothetical protein
MIRRRWVKFLSIVLIAMAAYRGYRSHMTDLYVLTESSAAEKALEQVKFLPQAASDVLRIRIAVDTLEAESARLSWYNLNQKRKTVLLLELLNIFLSDHHLTTEETSRWLAKFDHRVLIGRKTLRRYVREERRRAT